jgi:hypothetical protein
VFQPKTNYFSHPLAYTRPPIPASDPHPHTHMSRPHPHTGLVPSCPVFCFYKNAKSASVPASAGGTRPQCVWPLLLPLSVTVAVAGLWGGWRHWNSVAKRVLIQSFCRVAGRRRIFGAWEKTSRKCERSPNRGR